MKAYWGSGNVTPRILDFCTMKVYLGARTANGTAVCHQVHLYRYFVSQSGKFCRHNPLCCFLTSVCC
jgi:hypothetical protein